ncbi:hypothetical protein Q5692_30585 [Microcoleus sp. C2C3]|uniref:hypothetical protein n=1 Tax=unclassified Microcoleus TaxID=2642155 RepID=UPI002FD41C22
MSRVRAGRSLSETTARPGKNYNSDGAIELSPELARDGRLLLDCKDIHKSQRSK